MGQMLGGQDGQSGGGIGDMLESMPMGMGGGMGLFSSPKQQSPQMQTQGQGFDQNALMQQLMAMARNQGMSSGSRVRWR